MKANCEKDFVSTLITTAQKMVFGAALMLLLGYYITFFKHIKPHIPLINMQLCHRQHDSSLLSRQK